MKNTMKTLLGVLLALTLAVGLLPGMLSTAHAAHTHNWFYDSQGNVVSAHCVEDECPDEDILLTLNTPSNLVSAQGTVLCVDNVHQIYHRIFRSRKRGNP